MKVPVANRPAWRACFTSKHTIAVRTSVTQSCAESSSETTFNNRGAFTSAVTSHVLEARI